MTMRCALKRLSLVSPASASPIGGLAQPKIFKQQVAAFIR